MRQTYFHTWKLSPKDAISFQKKLRKRVSLTPSLRMSDVHLIAGADVSYSRQSDRCYAAIVILSFPELDVVEQRTAWKQARFPYVPGLLSFREVPALLKAFKKLTTNPDVLMLDSQGIAHPRGIGLASHIGVLLNAPSIGCAKSRLVGTFNPPDEARGSWSFLISEKSTQKIGCVLRTKDRCKPMFVSPGHKTRIAFARQVVLKCYNGYRLPEPTRQAHLLSNALRREME